MSKPQIETLRLAAKNYLAIKSACYQRFSLHFFILLMLAGNIAAAETTTRTVLDGVFTQAQIGRGKTAYSRYCSDCHLGNLQGEGLEPPLTGSLFLDAWREDYLSSLFAYIQTRMPKGRDNEPGSLKENQYLDILAYILAQNDFPVGGKELASADLANIMLTGLDGPAPLPPGALGRVVGCFTEEGTAYGLTSASPPSRVREADVTDELEVAKSALAPLGEHTYVLNNIGLVVGENARGALVGQKVQAKGVINIEASPARIHVLSLVDTGQSCDR